MAAASQGDLFSSGAPTVQSEAAPVAPPPVLPKHLMLVDASGFVFRAYHALPPLTTSKGVPTHAALGFARMMLKLLRDRKPDYVALCFDKDSRKGRLDIDPTYKANRAQTPQDLVVQFATVRRVAEVLSLPVVEFAGWEADDVAATLTARARAEGFTVEIVTSDKDFAQLVSDGVTLYDPAKNVVVGESEVMAKYGVRPGQMRDYLSLVGDAVDNVAKVPGIGPKTAVELLLEFGDVDTLLAQASKIKKPKVRDALLSHREVLLKAKDLVTFRASLPLTQTLEDFARRPPQLEEAKKLFTELEFHRLVQDLPQGTPTVDVRPVSRVADTHALAEFSAWLGAMGQAPVAVFAVVDGAARTGPLLALGFCARGVTWGIDVAALGGETVAEALRGATGSRGLSFDTHDAKGLLHALARLKVAGSPAADVELMAALLNPARREHALDAMVQERLGFNLSTGEASVRAGQCARAIEALVGPLTDEAKSQGLWGVVHDLELPLVPILAQMERAGLCVDRERLREVSVHVDSECSRLLADVYRLAGKEFNVGSPAQLGRILYDELKLPVLKKNKTGPSTDHEVLEKLADLHALPRAIIDYRNVAKLKNTYLDTLPDMIEADGRIRTTLHQTGAATGRLSSTNPNLQNIPIRTEVGRHIRRAFVAPPGQVLVSADYSQIELRILAHVSGDEGLVQAFKEGADVHARTAAEVFGVPMADVTEGQRRAAKMVNYGIAYGLSAHGLSARLNIGIEESASIIERYFARYGGIRRYLDETVESVKRLGYVESLFGRRRYLPDITSKNRNVAQAAERAAINMPIQGTAADLMKRAMLTLAKSLPNAAPNARMLLQVHDELLFEAPVDEAQGTADAARAAMEGAGSLRVPLDVDVGQGQSWADAH